MHDLEGTDGRELPASAARTHVQVGANKSKLAPSAREKVVSASQNGNLEPCGANWAAAAQSPRSSAMRARLSRCGALHDHALGAARVGRQAQDRVDLVVTRLGPGGFAHMHGPDVTALHRRGHALLG